MFIPTNSNNNNNPVPMEPRNDPALQPRQLVCEDATAEHVTMTVPRFHGELQLQARMEDDEEEGSLSLYRDFCTVQPGPTDMEVVARGGITAPFPVKLHEMLERVEKDGFGHIVSWQPHGRCFMVHNIKKFVKYVMPRYFRQTKFPSFQRQLNLYGFSRLTVGRDKGAYYHELCLRGKAFLTTRIMRMKIKGTKVRSRSDPDCEPNFYKLPFLAGTNSNNGAATTATTVVPYQAASTQQVLVPAVSPQQSVILHPQQQGQSPQQHQVLGYFTVSNNNNNNGHNPGTIVMTQYSTPSKITAGQLSSLPIHATSSIQVNPVVQQQQSQPPQARQLPVQPVVHHQQQQQQQQESTSCFEGKPFHMLQVPCPIDIVTTATRPHSTTASAPTVPVSIVDDNEFPSFPEFLEGLDFSDLGSQNLGGDEEQFGCFLDALVG